MSLMCVLFTTCVKEELSCSISGETNKTHVIEHWLGSGLVWVDIYGTLTYNKWMAVFLCAIRWKINHLIQIARGAVLIL